jgi:uncharacterized oxidoreductase
VGADLAGHDSHGVGMVPRYVKSLLVDELQLNRTIAVHTDAGGILGIDGQRGMGQSVTHQAMDAAIARARETGVCVMGLRNAHHLGRVGHWAEQAVAAGMVSIHFTNALGSQVLVAPHGGIEPRFLTNPFTVGIPRDDGEAAGRWTSPPAGSPLRARCGTRSTRASKCPRPRRSTRRATTPATRA